MILSQFQFVAMLYSPRSRHRSVSRLYEGKDSIFESTVYNYTIS